MATSGTGPLRLPSETYSPQVLAEALRQATVALGYEYRPGIMPEPFVLQQLDRMFAAVPPTGPDGKPLGRQAERRRRQKAYAILKECFNKESLEAYHLWTSQGQPRLDLKD